MNQSEFEANICNWRQARENACDQNTIGFGLTSHWLRKWRFASKSQNTIKQNRSKREITFDTQCKSALFKIRGLVLVDGEKNVSTATQASSTAQAPASTKHTHDRLAVD